jgi:hypothetical protein
MCLDVPGFSTAAGAHIQQWPCNGGTNQQWNFVPLGGLPGWYRIVSRSSGMCLDLPYSSTALGVQLQQWPCHPEFEANQVWSLQCGAVGQNCCPSPSGGAMTCGDPSMACFNDHASNVENDAPIMRCETCGGFAQPCCTTGQACTGSNLACSSQSQTCLPQPPPPKKTCSNQNATPSATTFTVGLRDPNTGCGSTAQFFANNATEAQSCAARAYGSSEQVMSTLPFSRTGSYQALSSDGTEYCQNFTVSVFSDNDVESCERAKCEAIYGGLDYTCYGSNYQNCN